MSELRPSIPTITLEAYQRLLDDCWALHLAPRSPDAPTVVSLFAGCGGSSLGYSMAGFRELLAVERDNNAAAVFRINFPEVALWHDDITRIDQDRIEGIIPSGELDVLDGSPPCQGFSIIGNRFFDDPRNRLFKEYCRFLTALKPKVFVMENVSGMVRGSMKSIFVEILKTLKSCGYNVSVRLMDALYFHVPQNRERVIFIGTRQDLPINPSHPIAQSGPIQAFNLDCREGKYSRIRFGDHVVKPNRPCHTVARRDRLYWDESHEFGVKSYAINTSFPSQFQFVGTRTNIVDRIGNSVPPLFMYAIARHIRFHLLDAINSVK